MTGVEKKFLELTLDKSRFITGECFSQTTNPLLRYREKKASVSKPYVTGVIKQERMATLLRERGYNAGYIVSAWNNSLKQSPTGKQ